MARRALARRAMTLSEVIAVVTILGLLGAMAFMRFGNDALGDVGAQGFARHLTLDCLQARARSISTGDNHFLQFTLAGPNATQYALYRRQGGTDVRVDDVQVVPTDVVVNTGGDAQFEFSFTGEALAAYSVTVAGPDRTWQVAIPQLTGSAIWQEL